MMYSQLRFVWVTFSRASRHAQRFAKQYLNSSKTALWRTLWLTFSFYNFFDILFFTTVFLGKNLARCIVRLSNWLYARRGRGQIRSVEHQKNFASLCVCGRRDDESGNLHLVATERAAVCKKYLRIICKVLQWINTTKRQHIRKSQGKTGLKLKPALAKLLAKNLSKYFFAIRDTKRK